jgi:heme-degrading monooxygenase HmoA
VYVIIWEYQVRAERVAEFEEIYSPVGRWAKLFQKGKGYLGTELLAGERRAHRYLTIDRWRSAQAYESFLAEWKKEYEDLDAECGGLSESETLLGTWGEILPKSP